METNLEGRTVSTETYTLNRAAIAAHLRVAAKADIRFYLNGVHLNPGAAHLVSADGSAMLVTQHDELKRPGAPSLVLPREALAASLKLCPKKAETFEVDVTPAGISTDPATLVFRPAPGISNACTAVDGRYPEYSRVIPATVDGTPGNYDPELLEQLGAALRDLAGLKSLQMVRVYQNGAHGAAWVMLCDTCHAPPHVGIIMPCREKDASTKETAAVRVSAIMGARS